MAALEHLNSPAKLPEAVPCAWLPKTLQHSLGAHLLLKTRTQTLDGSLRSTFRQWYPGMANDNHENGEMVRAA
ncbi:hypothetical protein [Mesorhizobium sp. AA22]|uniref:hypothetical protein n=1 Tax=Mesorhizobium sp. AA22 TaxID=1854057 RepID=UPI001140D303|nr:hypothetical protein [Mesorhizobium sp. AA22]QIA25454.1 hypothetical protein A9K68_029825 [Mesorhizobium sp. AA22]